VHGYITLELGEHFTEFTDPVAEVLLPMGVTFSVGLGDRSDRAQASLVTRLLDVLDDMDRLSAEGSAASAESLREAVGLVDRF